MVFAYVLAALGNVIELKDAMSGTIAYAGILVVFVGTIVGAGLNSTGAQ